MFITKQNLVSGIHLQVLFATMFCIYLCTVNYILYMHTYSLVCMYIYMYTHVHTHAYMYKYFTYAYTHILCCLLPISTIHHSVLTLQPVARRVIIDSSKDQTARTDKKNLRSLFSSKHP